MSNLVSLTKVLYTFATLDSTATQWDTLKALGDVAKQGYETGSALNHDDFVGVVREIDTDCYVKSSGPTWHQLIDENGNNDGSWVELDTTNDVDREMCDPGSFDPVNVSMSGPTQIPTWAAEGCGYTATATGGAGLNSYEWRWDGTLVGTNSNWVPSGGLSTGFHLLRVDVDDSYTGTSAADSVNVHVDDSYSCI